MLGSHQVYLVTSAKFGSRNPIKLALLHRLPPPAPFKLVLASLMFPTKTPHKLTFNKFKSIACSPRSPPHRNRTSRRSWGGQRQAAYSMTSPVCWTTRADDRQIETGCRRACWSPSSKWRGGRIHRTRTGKSCMPSVMQISIEAMILTKDSRLRYPGSSVDPPIIQGCCVRKLIVMFQGF